MDERGESLGTFGEAFRRERLSRSCEVNLAGIAECKAVNLSAHVVSLLRRFSERVHKFNDGRLTFAADDKIHGWMLT